jgi:exopolyphosphatase / guanosine-5'-triphosphate,3'-diphosphate pyrophosphatase
VAAIDIGTNSIRLLVAEAWQRSSNGLEIKAVARAGEPCRLGRGLGKTGAIDPGAAKLAADLATEFAARARSLGAQHLIAGATAALRDARNGSEVADLIGDQSGLSVRILTGEEEAQLVYRSVVSGLGPAASRSSSVVFDIGGGSTEVVSGFGLEPGRWTSLPIGAVSLTERHLHSNPPSLTEVEEAQSAIRSEIMHRCALMPDRTPLLAGVGGTVTVLALIDRALTSYDPALLEGWLITRERLDAMIERLVGSSQEERRILPAMGEGRADIVVAGCLVVSLLIERFPSSGLVCSTQGLRYGLARMAAEELFARRREQDQIP